MDRLSNKGIQRNKDDWCPIRNFSDVPVMPRRQFFRQLSGPVVLQEKYEHAMLSCQNWLCSSYRLDESSARRLSSKLLDHHCYTAQSYLTGLKTDPSTFAKAIHVIAMKEKQILACTKLSIEQKKQRNTETMSIAVVYVRAINNYLDCVSELKLKTTFVRTLIQNVLETLEQTFAKVHANSINIQHLERSAQHASTLLTTLQQLEVTLKDECSSSQVSNKATC